MKTSLTTIAARRCWLVSLLGLAMTGLAMTGLATPDVSAEAMAAAARTGRAVVLQTFGAGQFGFDLAIAQCRRSECPVEVRLRSAGRIVDRVTLPVAASSQRARTEIVDAVWGADPGLKAWATGAEHRYVSTVARLLRLTPRTTALLVSQQYGFEHLKRNHLVILPRAGKLHIVWKAEEGSGPTWSATQIIGSPDRREIVYFHGFFDPDENTAERLDAVRLDFDAASARLHETALPDRARPLYLLNLGIHETVAQAREARSANAYCLTPYWILDASRFRADAGGQAIIGALYATRASAEAAARAAKGCLPGVTASLEMCRARPSVCRSLTAARSSHGPARPSAHSPRDR